MPHGSISGGQTSTATAQTAADASGPVSDPIVAGVPVKNPTDAWTGSTATYMSAPPSLRANDQHGGMSVTGKPCLGCHDGKTCIKFDFAGTVWKAPALTVGAADVEVRIIDANDLAYDVHSDADGNFWHRSDTDLALPAFSGVRTANWKAIGKLNGTSCNTCHDSSNTMPGRLFVQ